MNTPLTSFHFRTRIFAVGILSVFLLSAGSVAAYTAMSGKDLSMKNPLNDDLYAAGGEVTIDQPVNGDVTVLGGTVNIDDDVSGDVLVLGGRVTISGNVGDDIRVAGGSVTVTGNVKDDLIAVGGNLELSKSGSVGGSVMVHGGVVSIDGNITENVSGSAAIMKIKGWINGNVQVDTSDYLSVSQSAKIRGNLLYSSKNITVIPPGTVTGKTDRTVPSHESVKTLIFGFYSVGMLLVRFWNFLALLVVGAALFAFFPQEFSKRPELLRKSFWKSLGLGFLGLTAGGAFIIFCLVTIIGAPLGSILAAGAGALWYLSQLVVGLFLGNLIFKPKPRSPRRTYGIMALGLLAYTLISLVPVVGSVVNFILVLAAFGVMLQRQHEWIALLRGVKK